MSKIDIFIDIETVPSGKLEDFKLTEDDAPKNYKDKEKIEAWIKENQEKKFRDRAVDPNYARIISLAYAIGDNEIVAIYGDDPHEILSNFYSQISDFVVADQQKGKLYYNDYRFIGINNKKFDMEVIWVSAMKMGIYDLCKLIPRDRFTKKILDVCEIWNGPNYMNYVSMNTMCDVLGFEGKGDMEGSKVYDEYISGNLESVIVPYNISDVDKLRRLFKVLEKSCDL